MTDGSVTRRRYLLAAGAGGLTFLAGCSGGGDDDSGDGPDGNPTAGPASTEQSGPLAAWPTFQYDAARSGAVAGGTPPTDGVTERWNTRLASTDDAQTFRIQSSPVVANGTVFVGGPRSFGTNTEGNLYALDAGDGTEQWSIENPTREAFESLMVDDGTVYAAEGSGRRADDTTLYALDAGDGSERWAVELIEGTGSDALAVSQGTVFLSTTSILQAFDTADGSERWSVDISQPLESGITVAEGAVYCPGTERLVAFDASDGSERWSASLPASSTPAVVDGTLYTAFSLPFGGSDNVFALGTDAGETEWSTAVPPDAEGNVPVSGSPAVDRDTVYVSSEQGVHALARSDGSERWTASFPSDRISPSPYEWSAPVVVGDTLYLVRDDGRLYALATGDGSERWSVETGATDSAPAVADGTVYVGGTEGRVYALTEP
jgi:outer membrane protein assembly factor BamB